MGAAQYPIPAIYLHLVAVMDSMSLKQMERAKTHLLSAWDLADRTISSRGSVSTRPPRRDAGIRH